MKVFGAIYRVWVSILTAAVAVQIFLAGYGAFDNAHKLDADGSTIDSDSFNNSFEPHITLGYLIWLGTIVLLLISFGTRNRSRIYRALGAFGLLTLQVMLALFGFDLPYVAGGLHPLNAFVILGFLGSITYREWRGGREAAVEPATV